MPPLWIYHSCTSAPEFYKSGMNYGTFLEFGYHRGMTTPQLDALDSVAARISELRAATRQALINGDLGRTLKILGQLKSTESAWHSLIASVPAPVPVGTFGHAETPAGAAAGFARPAREQIHRVLSLIGVPARPMFIVHIHNALFPGQLSLPAFTSLRRDDERSWHKGSRRPYYITPALSADELTPVRGLLTLSTWAPEARIVGPLSDRADYLITTSVIGHTVLMIEDAQGNPDHPASALLEGLAGSALNMVPEPGEATFHPSDVIAAADRAYQEIGPQDRADRLAGASALSQLTPAEQLFGKASAA